MKIAFLTPEYPPRCGGIGYYVYYLVQELLKEGIESLVIVRARKDGFHLDGRIPIYEVGCPGIAPLNFPLVKKRVELFLKNVDADILHIHSSSMPCIETRMPVVVTAHSCLAEATKIYHRPIRDLSALYRNLLFPVYFQVERKLARRCDVLTVVSHAMQGEFLKHHGVKSEVIRNAVDIEAFSPDGGKKENMILFTGMFVIGKGLIELIAAAHKIEKYWPSVKFLLIGMGPLQSYIMNKLKQNHADNIHVLNYLPHSKLIQFYRRSLLYVLPSYYEGLPTTILEAMACGLPIVGTEVGGIPDEIEDGINGFLVPPKRPDILAQKICALLEEPLLREEMGHNSRNKVKKQFTWRRVVRCLKTIYDSLY